MKRYLLLSLLAVAFLSCKKNKDSIPPSIVGTWEIRSEYGRPTIFYLPGNDTIIKYTHNTFEYFIDGVRISNGNYRLFKDTYQGNKQGFRIIYDLPTTGDIRTFYRLEGNKLSFYSNPDYQDGGGSSYERIQ